VLPTSSTTVTILSRTSTSHIYWFFFATRCTVSIFSSTKSCAFHNIIFSGWYDAHITWWVH